MDSGLSQHLETLGLKPDASWEEVTQAYKDLMRVWHPDRFQSDERLRKKAEEHSQRINHAMGELKKLGKAGLEKARSTSASGNPRTHRPPPQREPRATDTNTHQHNARRDFSQSSFHFSIAPLIIRPRGTTALFRAAAAVAVAYLCYDSMTRSLANPQQEAFTIAIALASLDIGARNLLLLFIPRPVVSVDRAGLFLLKTGRLGWLDIESVWPVITPRFSQLKLTFSPHYLAKQSHLMRILLAVRRWGNPAHIVVPFNGLGADPVQVVNAMKLYQMHNQLSLEDRRSKWDRAVLILHLLSLLCFAIPIARCLMAQGLSISEHLVYVALFLVCRIGELVLRIARSST
jgi:hypothetical protein